MFKTSLTLAAGLAALLVSAWAIADPVNINTADVQTLASELKGVGATTAQAIISYREQHGPFRSAEDLRNVKGVGERIVEVNRAQITVEDSTEAEGAN